MTDIQAALGSSQLLKLDSFIERRKEIVQKYNKAFQDNGSITIPYQTCENDSSWHLYIIQVPQNRREVFKALQARNIGVNVHYIPVHMLPYYQEIGYKNTHLPMAEKLYEHIITLPLFPGMTDQDVEDVIQAVQEVLDNE